ncbi:PREDICTED: uncharacterized protein LOC104610828 [Nelumbo nucifera]|uniref:Uncharacterized protein LOC104610828 n=2 Tax=Nelumbo nucifera TaxID=4432 RepID=A0A1U8BGC3_NELNU|nr:PREDICTED: uncharacterized protein LOC104610828 [Nelumbo nucifera]XP_019055547.1 PREDICTED: uncharacterized protein LOC104610828 [Nelumbo nucifera]DAD33938.1 TPA_asm: hypothetical protein HUJ06_012789 [Nelumbo nucifera]
MIAEILTFTAAALRWCVICGGKCFSKLKKKYLHPNSNSQRQTPPQNVDIHVDQLQLNMLVVDDSSSGQPGFDRLNYQLDKAASALAPIYSKIQEAPPADMEKSQEDHPPAATQVQVVDKGKAQADPPDKGNIEAAPDEGKAQAAARTEVVVDEIKA